MQVDSQSDPSSIFPPIDYSSVTRLFIGVDGVADEGWHGVAHFPAIVFRLEAIAIAINLSSCWLPLSFPSLRLPVPAHPHGRDAERWSGEPGGWSGGWVFGSILFLSQ